MVQDSLHLPYFEVQDNYNPTTVAIYSEIMAISWDFGGLWLGDTYPEFPSGFTPFATGKQHTTARWTV